MVPLIFSTHGQRSRSNCCYVYKWCSFNIFWLLFLKVAKLGTMDVPRDGCYILIFSSCDKKWRSKKVKTFNPNWCLLIIFCLMVTMLQTLIDFIENIAPIDFGVTRSETNSCMFSFWSLHKTLLKFAPGAIYVSQSFLDLFFTIYQNVKTAYKYDFSHQLSI